MRKQLHIIFRLVMFSCILLFVSQEASAQITFSVKNQTIRQTIRVIEKKADYSFFYTDKLPGLDQKISLTVSNESIDAVLEKVFKGSSISYKIESGKQVVLTLKSEQNAPQKGDKKTITGVVADRRGEPLIGVTESGGREYWNRYRYRRSFLFGSSCGGKNQFLLYRLCFPISYGQ